ncbi:MAG: fumarylacetoacetate hydrolase family protein [Pararhodobacter sp.]|nr:fumarylacetoacetate hydrolase family protein [Pararhodobacter sp.]
MAGQQFQNGQAAAVDALLAAHAGGGARALRAPLVAPGDLAGAYAVQEGVIAALREGGRRTAGYKIGMTAAPARRMTGATEPVCGYLFADTARESGACHVLSMSSQARVEAEVALVLGRDLSTRCAGPDDLLDAVAFAVPAIEVIQTRFGAWDQALADIIADNVWYGGHVLGAPRHKLVGLDLKAIEMRLDINGNKASTGRGADCFGGPLEAALWLTRHLAGRGLAPRAGDTILTGALGPMVPASAGDRIEVTLSGLGNVTATLAAPAS